MASNFLKICSSPTNKSKSKMLYSFSKAPRFPPTPKIQCEKFYEITQKKRSKRAAGIGYDHKYDFTKDLPESPPPNQYQIATTFDEGKSKNKGFCFGGGRQEMQLTGPLGVIKTNQNPGPCDYHLPSTVSKTAYSIRGRFKYVEEQQMKIPGPGTYETQQYFSTNAKHCLSRYRNNPRVEFSRSSERFRTSENNTPGPAAYDTSNTDFSATGVYYYSKASNSRARKFTKAHRNTLSAKNLNPGPGGYQVPSQFGYYMPFAKKNKQPSKRPQSEVQREDKQNVK